MIANDPYAYQGTVVDNGHCVRHVQIVSGIGHTSTWRKGNSVADVEGLMRGTVIATFGQNGRYENKTDGSSHAALFLEHQQDGILVMDQWIGKPVSERLIRYKAGESDPVNDASAYYVVET